EIDAAIIFSDKNISIENSKLISGIVDISNKVNTNSILNSLDSNQDATLIFTSGSSSKPKAVLHTFSNHYYSALGSNENLPLHQNDRWLLSLPIYHVGGLGIIFRCFQAGASIIIPPYDYNLSEFIIMNNITHLSLVSTQLHRLLKDIKNKNLLSLKAILLGGSKIPSSLVKEALDLGLPIYKSYGMTEMASQICTTEKLNLSVNHSGQVLSYRAVRLSSKNEILVKGETLFKGYYLNGKLNKPLNSEGWFSTGDIGQFDNDNNLVVAGRIDNQFISGGENISPEEIENIIAELYDFEKVIVVPVLDKEFGERPVIFISGEFDKNEIVEKLNKKLPSYKIPDYFFKWPEDLTEISIKPSRDILKQMAEKLIKN
ncbi:MAG: o-succinylbenzoate--CoA ligase, partial [candidate division Zixibacteria bacterium]|nr:o-succinylbenzoate--CoA ligase [candidate division Zixibacteria bacterium]